MAAIIVTIILVNFLPDLPLKMFFEPSFHSLNRYLQNAYSAAYSTRIVK